MDCLFCKIIDKKIPAKIEYEDGEVLAFHDIHPQAPKHVLFIPKNHISQVSELTDSDCGVAGALLTKAKKIADCLGVKDYRLVFNNGPEAGQTVFHIHMHLLAGRKLSWPPG